MKNSTKNNSSKLPTTYYQQGSVVLRVVGLIIVLSLVFLGAALVNSINSEYNLRQIAYNVNKMKYAVLSFKNIYGAFPGDISNATFNWSDETRNGDGDGKIFHINTEGLLAWQHLKLAKLLELDGNLDANLVAKWQDSKPIEALAGYNVPSSHIKNAGYYLDFSEDFGGNFLGFGSEVTGSVNNGAVLTPNEMMKLDIMIDDGLPNSGNLLAFSKTQDECFVSGEYKISSNKKECSAIFKF
jgi:hypothetical protein